MWMEGRKRFSLSPPQIPQLFFHENWTVILPFFFLFFSLPPLRRVSAVDSVRLFFLSSMANVPFPLERATFSSLLFPVSSSAELQLTPGFSLLCRPVFLPLMDSEPGLSFPFFFFFLSPAGAGEVFRLTAADSVPLPSPGRCANTRWGFFPLPLSLFDECDR